MHINIGRGLRRLWWFFTFVWVVFCLGQVWEARQQVKKAETLLTYYKGQSEAARSMQGRPADAIVGPVVAAHLDEQVEQNTRTIAEQTARADKYSRWSWFIPLILLPFVLGIPWVWRGFTG